MVNELELKIKDIIPRTHNVKSFRLEVGEKIEYKAGQYMIVTIKTDMELSRFLSFSSSPTEEGYIEFTKKITGSDFSRALDSFKENLVRVKYPFGRFTFEGEYKKIAFLSGGIGITPVRSICKFVIDKKIGTDMILIYGNETVRNIIFKEELDAMQKEHSNLRVVHVIHENVDYNIPARVGLITRQVIEEVIPDYIERKFYTCGPPAMVDAMRKILNELALSKENIIFESFKGY